MPGLVVFKPGAVHPVTTATIKALQGAFAFSAFGRKSKSPAMRVVVDSIVAKTANGKKLLKR